MFGFSSLIIVALLNTPALGYSTRFGLPASVSRRQQNSEGNSSEWLVPSADYAESLFEDLLLPTNNSTASSPGRQLGEIDQSMPDWEFGLPNDTIVVSTSKCASRKDLILGPWTFLDGTRRNATWGSIWDDALSHNPLKSYHVQGINLVQSIQNNLAVTKPKIEGLIQDYICPNSTTAINAESEFNYLNDELRRKLLQFPPLQPPQAKILYVAVPTGTVAVLGLAVQAIIGSIDEYNTTFTEIITKTVLGTLPVIGSAFYLFEKLETYYNQQNLARFQAAMLQAHQQNLAAAAVMNAAADQQFQNGLVQIRAHLAAAGLEIAIDQIADALRNNRPWIQIGGRRRRDLDGRQIDPDPNVDTSEHLTCAQQIDLENAVLNADLSSYPDGNFLSYNAANTQVQNEQSTTCPAGL